MLTWSKLSLCFISYNTVIWGFKSSGIVGWVVTSVSKDCGAFIFKGQALFLDEHTMFLQHVAKRSPNDAASHPRRPECSATPLCLGFVINSQPRAPAQLNYWEAAGLQQTPSPENPWRPWFVWTWFVCTGCRSFVGCIIISSWPMRTGYCYTGPLFYSNTIICHFLLLFHCTCAQLAEWTMFM